MSFVHLHIYSAYSLLNSTIQIDQLVNRAAQMGFSALALTDENVMYGSIQFYKACKRSNIKPILGITLTIKAEFLKENNKSYPLVLLAKNNEGYRHLLRLSTFVQTEFKDGIPLNILKDFSSELIAISPVDGEFHQLIHYHKHNETQQLAQAYKQIFSEDFYMAIDASLLSDLEAKIGQVLNVCKGHRIQLVVANPTHYLEKEDAIIHKCLQSIKRGQKLKMEGIEHNRYPEHHLKEKAEIHSKFSFLSEAIENTVKIANQCEVSIQLNEFVLPKYPLPTNTTSAQYLKSLCEKGLEKRYNPTPSEEATKRLEYELKIINNMNFNDYFLIVWDFMSYAHKNNILTGPGRGSAAGSLVAYALGITNVDPLKYNLLFERFLNPERISMPDIDIDFPDHRRDEMIQYVSEKYGKDHVAQIITFGTLAARASIRDVGRVLGMPLTEVDRLAKMIPSRPGILLEQALKESIPLQNELKQNEEARQLFNIALKIEGLPRHTSTHAAGVVISEYPLTDVVPLQEGHEGVLLTQYPMENLEDIGLLKMDFLGLRNLTLLETIQKLIYKGTGQSRNLNNIPMDDDKTFSLLGEGDTSGVFQLESTGMRRVITRLKPTSFEDIVAVNALYRPGPMDNIPLFIDRKHGSKKTFYPHPDIKEILEPTYGIIVYQEQIMQIASKMAGFSLGEADLLRRAVSKKNRDVLEKERAHFIKGCLQKGYEKLTAEQIYDLIVRFANYGFNRSHAVAYSIISYWLAYLKANFSLYFICALLSSVVGNEDKIAQYIGEAKQKDIKILPPSINRSSYQFAIEEGKIRFSLVPIKNVGYTAIKEILYQRKKGLFQDLFDFCGRVSVKVVNRRVIESLILSGSMDEFGKDRAVMLASLDAALDYAELVNEGDSGFFLADDIVPKPQYIEVEPLITKDKLQFEKEILGFYLSNHPIEPYKDLLKRMNATTIALLRGKLGSIVDIGALLVDTRTIKTKKGEQMAFLNLSDDTGDIAAVAFPRTFKKYGQLLSKGEILLIQGKVEERDQQLQLIINELTSITKIKANAFEKVYLRVDKDQQQRGKLHQIKSILKQYPGTTEVYIHYKDDLKTVILPKEWSVKLSEECLKKLRKVLGVKNVVIKK